MSNLHHPARLDGESFPEYRQRRADSQKVVARALRGRLYFGPTKDQTRRALVKVHGRRQALRQIKHDRAEMKLERAIDEGEARGYVAHDERDDVFA